jgi:hypothetical protein
MYAEVRLPFAPEMLFVLAATPATTSIREHRTSSWFMRSCLDAGSLKEHGGSDQPVVGAATSG